MIDKPPPLNRDYNRDPNIQALKRRGFINQGSTLALSMGNKTVVPQLFTAEACKWAKAIPTPKP